MISAAVSALVKGSYTGWVRPLVISIDQADADPAAGDNFRATVGSMANALGANVFRSIWTARFCSATGTSTASESESPRRLWAYWTPPMYLTTASTW